MAEEAERPLVIKVKKIKEDSAWLKSARGKVFKMVSMLLYDLPPDEKYKIILEDIFKDEILKLEEKFGRKLIR